MYQVISNQLENILSKGLKAQDKKRKHMSSALSAQYWDTSHLNIPTRKVIKQNPLGDKEAYLRECALPARKKVTI
jgi:hypothetical protein